MTTVPPLSEPPSDPATRALNEAFATSTQWHEPAWKLRASMDAGGIDQTSDESLPARLATGFFLDFPEPARAVALTSSRQLDGGKALTPKDCSEETAATWERVATETQILSLKAILYDLLTQRGGKSVPHYADKAIRAYCDLVENPSTDIVLNEDRHKILTWESYDLAIAIARGLALVKFNPRPGDVQASSLNQADRVTRLAIDRIKELSVTGETPGLLVMLADQLMLDVKRLLPEQIDDVKAAILSRFNAALDPDLVDSLSTLLQRLKARPAEELNARRVTARMDRADNSHPMVAMTFLRDAQNLARDLGLTDLAREATRRMQSLRTADFGWQKLSSEVTVGRELIESQIRAWSRGTSAIEALTSWSQSPPPTGNYQAAKEAAAARAAEPRITNLVTREIYAADGLPYLTIATPEERILYELSVADEMALGLDGLLLADGLDHVARYGIPTKAALLDWLIGHGEDEMRPTAQALSAGLYDFWNKDYEISAARVIPNIEAALRQVVLLLDEPAYVAARKGMRSKYLGIDQLLPLLGPYGFDPDWDHSIRAFCLGPYGMNTRNDFAHGFQLRKDPRITAALSLRFLLLFVRMGGKPDRTPKRTVPTAPMVSVTMAFQQLVTFATKHPAVAPALLRGELADAKRLLSRALPLRRRH